MTEDHKPNPDREGFGSQADLISNAIAFLSYAAREAAADHIEATAKLRGRTTGEREIEQLAQAQNVIGQATVLVGSLFKNLDRIAGAVERIADDLTLPEGVMVAAETVNPDLTGMRAALIAAAEQFEFYEQQHRAKATPESLDKAEVNRKMADRMRSAALLGSEASATVNRSPYGAEVRGGMDDDGVYRGSFTYPRD